jgi:hypothetical protein
MVTVAAFIAGLLQSSAAAAPVSAQLTSSYAGTVGLRAYGGLVVWSARRGDGSWALMQWRRGHVARVPVAGRDVPFDADVGPSVTGRPVVTYSRCVVDPDGAPEGLQLAPDWNHSRGCRIYVYDPHTRRERRAALPRPAGSSDTTPTIWRGDLAFVRRVDQHFPTLLLWHDGQLRREPGGTIPRCGANACRTGVNVPTLDLGSRWLAVLWQATGPTISGLGVGWELHADSLRDSSPKLLASGEPSGECGYGQPSSPTSVGRSIVFLAFQAACDSPDRGDFVLHTPGTLAVVTGSPPGLPLTAAQNGKTTYWVRDQAAGPHSHAADDCIAAPQSCTLMRSTGLISQTSYPPPAGPV